MNEQTHMWSRPVAQRAIVVAGCLAMAYTQLTMSPATIEFARALGGNGLHIGILGALPAAMLFMQFIAAVLANHLHYRRRVWLSLSIVQRLIVLPLAFGPFLLPSVADSIWIWGFILVTAMNHALLHFCSPLWLSWMGDYLPRDGLNRFWGMRQYWMQWTAAAALLAGAIFVLRSGVDVRLSFPVLVAVGAVCGIADLLFFLKIEEPPVRRLPEPRLWTVLAAPFRETGFRSFITYACFWHFAAMIGAPFISLFLLSHVGMDLFHLLLLWTFSWVGGALFAERLGHLAERFGSRPILILCTAFKSLNMIALLLVPAEPTAAFWILIPVFMIDALLNAGIAIANNGFMLKNSPSENRTMYIAAGTALAGMVGGATSIVAGAVLVALSSWQVQVGVYMMGGFHVLFALSLVLRWVTVLFALRVHEPAAGGTMRVVTQLIGVTPVRLLRFPVGLYRAMTNGGETTDDGAVKPQLERELEAAKAR